MNNALPSTDEHLENAGGDEVDKRAKRGDDDTPVASVAEVFELARQYFPERDGLPLLPPIRGRDPLVHRGTDKVRFFRGDRHGCRAEEVRTTSCCATSLLLLRFCNRGSKF